MGLLSLTAECRDALNRWDGVVGPPDPSNRGTKALKVFESDVVEWFAKSHPVLPGVWFGPVIAYGLWRALAVGPLVGLTVFALGVLAWTLLEYGLHRFAFHAKPQETGFGKLSLFMIHGYHHEFPDDPMRLVAPPLMSWPIAAVLALISRAVAGPDLWWPLFGGIVTGYLAYDWLHYYTHHVSPGTALGRYLRKIHLIHHFADGEKNMGISSPLWDFVFGTYTSSARKVGAAAASSSEA